MVTNKHFYFVFSHMCSDGSYMFYFCFRHGFAFGKYLYFKLQSKDKTNVFGHTKRNHLLQHIHTHQALCWSSISVTWTFWWKDPHRRTAILLVIPYLRKCVNEILIFSLVFSILKGIRSVSLHLAEHLPSQIILPEADFLKWNKMPTENSRGKKKMR